MATTSDQKCRGKLEAGKGLLGWIKLCRKYKQENATNAQTVVSFEELRKHNTENDCWTAFRGSFIRTCTGHVRVAAIAK